MGFCPNTGLTTVPKGLVYSPPPNNTRGIAGTSYLVPIITKQHVYVWTIAAAAEHRYWIVGMLEQKKSEQYNWTVGMLEQRERARAIECTGRCEYTSLGETKPRKEHTPQLRPRQIPKILRNKNGSSLRLSKVGFATYYTVVLTTLTAAQKKYRFLTVCRDGIHLLGRNTCHVCTVVNVIKERSSK